MCRTCMILTTVFRFASAYCTSVSPSRVLICPSVWASAAFLFVCICHAASVVWWLSLWFLSSQHSSKYSDKMQRTPRSLRPGQSIREKTTLRSGCFCSIKQPSVQQQPFSVWCVELILSRFLFLCIFAPSSLSITTSKTATNPAVRAVNSVCPPLCIIYPAGCRHNQLSFPQENLVVCERQWICNNCKPKPRLESWTSVMQRKSAECFLYLQAIGSGIMQYKYLMVSLLGLLWLRECSIKLDDQGELQGMLSHAQLQRHMHTQTAIHACSQVRPT